MKNNRLDSFLRNWKHLSGKYNMTRMEYMSVLNGLRHILKGAEKGGLEDAGQVILDLDIYLKNT